MITTTVMETTQPNITISHVQGMQKEELPGFYNSTCGIYSECFTQLNLDCVDFRCVCFTNFIPNDIGGCKEDTVTVLVTWIVRLLICTCVFFITLTVFHLLVSSRARQRRRPEPEEEDPEDIRISNNTCWYDEPPPYLEVTDEAPPPTYQEAVEKERESGSEAPTRATDRATPRSDAITPSRRGPEAVRGPSQSCPASPCLSSYDNHAYQTLHI